MYIHQKYLLFDHLHMPSLPWWLGRIWKRWNS